MGAYHAKLAPSSAFRWVDCTASVGAQERYPNTTNEASRHGTCCHQIGEECLLSGGHPFEYLGRVMVFPKVGREEWEDELVLPLDDSEIEARVTVDEEAVIAVEAYVMYVRNRVQSTGAKLIVEQQVPIGHITGEQDARGTADTVILDGDLLESIDAKFGRGKVYAYDIIEAESYDVISGEIKPPKYRMNLQLALYLLGAYFKHGQGGSFKRVKAVICQPYLNHVSEYECSLDELLALGEWLAARAELTRVNPVFRPSNKNCWFCKAKFDCHARNALVLETAVEGFEDVEDARPAPIKVPELGMRWALLDMIRQWCDDVESAVFAQWDAGREVLGPDGQPLKRVEGRRGHRVWRSEAEAQAEFERIRLAPRLMWVKTLISPSEAAQLVKKKRGSKEDAPIGKTQWSNIEKLITQPRGKAVIALSTDPRPPFDPNEPEMPEEEPISQPPADNSDLF
jgi:hypothetical protein